MWPAIVLAVGRGLDGLKQLIRGLGTALLALLTLVAVVPTVVACLAGVGLLAVAPMARAVRAVADRERSRLARLGSDLPSPGPMPRTLRGVLTDRSLPREVGWLACHATLGFVLGLFGVLLPLIIVRDLTFVAWWKLPPSDPSATSFGVGTAHTWWQASAISAFGLVGWIAILGGVVPTLARVQSWPGRRLLVPDPSVDLSMRVVELTATRAAALDAHAIELRRIERSLHDGSQNRLVAVTVLLGAARRSLSRNPSETDGLLERAQEAAESALAELRAVSRSILPPVLADRGLAGALTGLAANSGVPCGVELDVGGRCAASVEATAYFVVAEALTNVAKHSGAHSAELSAVLRSGRLRIRVTDDGHGGADAASGSGLDGIRRRVEAHDGTLSLTSPVGGPTILAVELPCGS
ncbi:sensor histidine kinase [Cryptosporangium sp. NPDC051539]|uniref:sensor histidine kinase n=1 Tax=Cryptosporangium sp. NPDC051539 TaxID=3363962 RepID=UPI0037AA69B6